MKGKKHAFFWIDRDQLRDYRKFNLARDDRYERGLRHMNTRSR